MHSFHSVMHCFHSIMCSFHLVMRSSHSVMRFSVVRSFYSVMRSFHLIMCSFHSVMCSFHLVMRSSHSVMRFSVVRSHIILRSKNLEYGARGNETKNHLYFLSKEKLSNGSPTTVRVGYVKTTYLIHFPKIHRSVLREITIDGRTMTYSSL